MDFWDSKISGKKKLAVDNKILALDDSGSSYFQCIFQIAPHIFNLKQKDEEKEEWDKVNEKEEKEKEDESKEDEKDNKDINNSIEEIDLDLEKEKQKIMITKKQ